MGCRIANLSERVVLQKRKVVEDESGEYQESWQDLMEVWAEITPLPTKEPEWNSIKKSVDNLQFRVVMRKITNRNALHAYVNRLRWRNRTLYLATRPLIDTKKAWVEFLAFEKEG